MNKERTLKNIWITKYWSTRGIYEAECESTSIRDCFRNPNTGNYFHKGDYPVTKELAELLIQPKILKMVKNLELKITKLKSMIK